MGRDLGLGFGRPAGSWGGAAPPSLPLFNSPELEEERGNFIPNICCLTKNFFPVLLRALQSPAQYVWARPSQRDRGEGPRRNPSPAPTTRAGDVARLPRPPPRSPPANGRVSRGCPKLPCPRPGARPFSPARGGPVPSPAAAAAARWEPPLRSRRPHRSLGASPRAALLP